VLQSSGHAAAEPLLVALLQEFEPLLNAHHATLFDARTPLLNCLRARGDAAAGAQQCSAIVASMEGALGAAAARETPAFLCCLGALIEKQARSMSREAVRKTLLARARDAYRKAAAARAVCLGQDHPATCEAAARARNV